MAKLVIHDSTILTGHATVTGLIESSNQAILV